MPRLHRDGYVSSADELLFATRGSPCAAGPPHRNAKLLADPTRFRQISERIPAGRWGRPQDFAGPIVFLSSDASQYVNGELLVVDGVCPAPAYTHIFTCSDAYIFTFSLIIVLIVPRTLLFQLCNSRRVQYRGSRDPCFPECSLKGWMGR
jgi:Enoyl-(Acyl carrier protein) reductase